ncbi:hypothetical protein [Streptococcus fryi]
MTMAHIKLYETKEPELQLNDIEFIGWVDNTDVELALVVDGKFVNHERIIEIDMNKVDEDEYDFDDKKDIEKYISNECNLDNAVKVAEGYDNV